MSVPALPLSASGSIPFLIFCLVSFTLIELYENGYQGFKSGYGDIK